MKSGLKPNVMFWVTALVLLPRAGAQTTAGLNGVVTDASRASIQGARASISNVDTGLKRESLTNDSGSYEFPLLPPGNYTLRVEKQGFRPITQEGIRLDVNQ